MLLFIIGLGNDDFKCGNHGGYLVNLALNRFSQHSSTRGSYVSDRAADGDRNPILSHQSCSHTNQDMGAWWSVQLDATYTISCVIIVNRGDALGRSS